MVGKEVSCTSETGGHRVHAQQAGPEAASGGGGGGKVGHRTARGGYVHRLDD